MKRRPATKAQLLARMPRAFRPKLDASQQRDLGLCHIAALDSLARGEANEQTLWDWVGSVLTWSKTAELLRAGTDEMALQLELATRMVNRYRDTGRIGLSGPDYQLAKVGVDIMDELARITDQPTASQAADWSQATLDKLSAACAQHRAAQANTAAGAGAERLAA